MAEQIASNLVGSLILVAAEELKIAIRRRKEYKDLYGEWSSTLISKRMYFGAKVSHKVLLTRETLTTTFAVRNWDLPRNISSGQACWVDMLEAIGMTSSIAQKTGAIKKVHPNDLIPMISNVMAAEVSMESLAMILTCAGMRCNYSRRDMRKGTAVHLTSRLGTLSITWEAGVQRFRGHYVRHPNSPLGEEMHKIRSRLHHLNEILRHEKGWWDQLRDHRVKNALSSLYGGHEIGTKEFSQIEHSTLILLPHSILPGTIITHTEAAELTRGFIKVALFVMVRASNSDAWTDEERKMYNIKDCCVRCADVLKNYAKPFKDWTKSSDDFTQLELHELALTVEAACAEHAGQGLDSANTDFSMLEPALACIPDKSDEETVLSQEESNEHLMEIESRKDKQKKDSAQILCWVKQFGGIMAATIERLSHHALIMPSWGESRYGESQVMVALAGI